MKNIKIKKRNKGKAKKKNKNTIPTFLKEKILYFRKVIRKTILIVQKYKSLDILGASELNVCIKNLEEIFVDLNGIEVCFNNNPKDEHLIEKLQNINNELAIIFRTFGTKKIDDLINIVYGKDYLKEISEEENTEIYNTIKQFVHPIGYKLMSWSKDHNPTTHTKKLAKNRIVEDFMIMETASNFDCFDLARTSRSFQTKVYGIKIALHHHKKRKTLIICGIVDDVLLQCINNPHLKNKLELLKKNKPNNPEFDNINFKSFLNSLTIKELLIYSENELYQKFNCYMTQTQLIKQKTIAQTVKEFLNSELYKQRTILIQLLIKRKDPEFQYLAYLLYDLLSNESASGNIDTVEQTILFDSLPWTIKTHFRNAMKTTIKYTKDLSNYDSNNIPIEQQICLMKATDTIKEKAMTKLKEVKAKSEDSGSKARQYLNALLKIPFGINKKEPVLNIMKKIKKNFKDLVEILKTNKINAIKPKKSYTSVQIFQEIKKIENNLVSNLKEKNFKKLKQNLCNCSRPQLINNVCILNCIIKQFQLKKQKICHSGKKAQDMKDKMCDFILKNKNERIMDKIYEKFNKKDDLNISLRKIEDAIFNIKNLSEEIIKYTKEIKKSLDDSIHGHKNAKRQIERIIGQWINGELTGYCFGFEGPPGIGKTSLAKYGLSNCLKDNDGKSRPFALIAMGGSSNASTLAGHNYTYVGSTWGRIVDILIEKKCMNPIIFIDELDKVSRTEHGKEIIGILTHLVDGTQNNCFQDKYFSGVDLDLSKALIIFSYNDPKLIDKILLDRIHRVKFDSLSLDEKITISFNYILPEIFKKVDLQDIIIFSREIISQIIIQYTNEAGVRKLKEILFEIISEINLEILSNKDFEMKIPYEITMQEIEEKYLKNRDPIKYIKTNRKPKIGIMNGLWANSLGLGGIITIETKWITSNNFLDLKLTGMQGDVMKESMNVAKSLAWELTSNANKQKIIKKWEKNKILGGIHIHCPEGATPKDGPSAGTAITIALFSLFNNKKIKNDIAITGEMNLQGNVTEIGGLDCKINGGIRAGVKEFIFPEKNTNQFNKFLEKYGENTNVKNTIFHKVSDIHQVLKLVFIN